MKQRINKTRKIYKESDYKSGDGMLTTVWGPSMWHYLHTMSFNYPVNPTKREKKHYRDFVMSLRHVLPCRHCRINLRKNFKILPLTQKCMKNREKFSMYIYNLHEHINTMLGKKSNLTYDDVRERYEHFRARCSSNSNRAKIFKYNKTLKKRENGCTEPLVGKKSKCIIKIVPQTLKCKTFQMDKTCKKRRLKISK